MSILVVLTLSNIQMFECPLHQKVSFLRVMHFSSSFLLYHLAQGLAHSRSSTDNLPGSVFFPEFFHCIIQEFCPFILLSICAIGLVKRNNVVDTGEENYCSSGNLVCDKSTKPVTKISSEKCCLARGKSHVISRAGRSVKLFLDLRNY